MIYRHVFRVNASLKEVADFHRRSASLREITPPPIRVRMGETPDLLTAGDEMAFTLLLGPFPIPWVAKIVEVSSNGFTDRQLSGPFSKWEHRHRFVSIEDNLTEVMDEVEARLRIHPYWGPVGWSMWIGLPLLFAFRGWKTRRLLEKK